MPLIITQILLGILSLCFAINLLYWCFGSLRFAFSTHHSSLITHHLSLPPVSVIICARNEAINIKKNLKLVLEQDYPVFEVIVVDDCSWDSTLTVLKEMEKDHSNLKTLQLKEDPFAPKWGMGAKHGKKLALTIAIKRAQYEHLVFMDADCYPASKNWLKKILEVFDEKTDIVLGYGTYFNDKGIINKLIRLDTFRIGLQYLSFAVARVPYMGIGRNLAYRKSLFLNNKGFSPHSQIPSGDDDLFVNKCANSRNTRIAVSTECTTISEPKKTFAEWVRQKRRHVSTAQYYKPSSKFLLGTLTLSQYFFWLTAIALLFIPKPLTISYWLLAFISTYLFVHWITYFYAMKKMGESKLFVYSLLLEWFILFIFYPVVALSNLLFKKAVWKT